MKVRLPILALVAIVIAAACSQPYSPTKVTSIAVSAAAGAYLSSDGTVQFSAKILPADASNLSVTWAIHGSSGAATISATIDSNGIATFYSSDTYTVTATANDGSGISGSLEYTPAWG